MKNFDEKAAQEMRVKAHQERERKRLGVRLQTRGILLSNEACMKSKKKNVNQPNGKDYLLIFTHAVFVQLDICKCPQSRIRHFG